MREGRCGKRFSNLGNAIEIHGEIDPLCQIVRDHTFTFVP